MKARYDCITHTLTSLETVEPAGQSDLIREQLKLSGGTLIEPKPDDNWDAQRVDFCLFGVHADGADWPEAIRNWKIAARRIRASLLEQLDQLEQAHAAVTGPGTTSTVELRAHCECLLSPENAPLVDPMAIEAARQTLAVLDRAEAS